MPGPFLLAFPLILRAAATTRHPMEMKMSEEIYEIWLRDLEELESSNDVARVLHESGAVPDGDAQLEALFVRAAAGSGYYSQLIAAYSSPD